MHTTTVRTSGHLLEDLQADRALPRDDVGVVEGVDEDRPCPLGPLPRVHQAVVHAAMDRARTQVLQMVEDSRHNALELAERKTHEEEALERTRAEFAESEIQVISLREELADKRSRLGSLEELQKNYEGFDRGVRAVMVRAGQQFREQGIFGLVADVLTHHAALRARGGGGAGRAAAARHRREPRRRASSWWSTSRRPPRAAAASCRCPTLEGVPPVVEPDFSRPGVLGSAYAEVKCEEALQPVVRLLLGDVVIVQDMASARAYAAAEGPRVHAGHAGGRGGARGRHPHRR